MYRASLEKFLQDCRCGVYNFTKDGKCSCCGNCCTSVLPVSKAEIKTIQRYVQKKHIKITAKMADVNVDMSCPFRDEINRICKVYEVRPAICRSFKCDFWQKQIEKTRDSYEFDSRYTVVNFRDIWR